MGTRSQDPNLWTHELEVPVREIMDVPVFKGKQNFSFNIFFGYRNRVGEGTVPLGPGYCCVYRMELHQAQDTCEAHLCICVQPKFSGIRQSLCLEGT